VEWRGSTRLSSDWTNAAEERKAAIAMQAESFRYVIDFPLPLRLLYTRMLGKLLGSHES